MLPTLDTPLTPAAAVEPSAPSATLPSISHSERMAAMDAAKDQAAGTMQDVVGLGLALGGAAKLMEKAFSPDPVGPTANNS